MIGVLLLVLLVAELCVLGYDLAEAGAGYLSVTVGYSYAEYVGAPVGFFPYDTALCAALVVLAVAAFTRRSWVRPAATALLAVNAFSAASGLFNQLVHGSSRAHFADPTSNLWLNLTAVLAVVIGIAVGVVVAATRTAGTAPGGPGLPAAAFPQAPTPYAPAPQAQAPYAPAPQAPAPQAAAPYTPAPPAPAPYPAPGVPGGPPPKPQGAPAGPADAAPQGPPAPPVG